MGMSGGARVVTLLQPPLQGVELSGLSAAISHFLNCFLSSYPNPVAHLPADELVSKKRNRRRRNRPPGAADNTAWAVMTPQELWKNICQEAKNYFDFSLEWYVMGAGALGSQAASGSSLVVGSGTGRRKQGAVEGCLLGEVGRGAGRGLGWRGSCGEGGRGVLGCLGPPAAPPQ